MENDVVRIEYEFVVEEVLKDLKGWCGSEIDQFPAVAAEVEKELNGWLRYSRLDMSCEDEAAADDGKPDPEFARAFLKHNALDTKLRIHRSASPAPSDDRIRQLEATVQQYADEVRTLEDRIRALQGSPVSIVLAPATSTVQPESHSEPDLAG